MDELLARLVADICEGGTLDPSALLPDRPDLKERVAETFALAQQIAVRRPAKLPRFPGYEVLSEIGRGGMGAVYLVRDPKLSRNVALKTMTSARVVGEAGRERFAREVRAIARLSHPHIVKVHEAGAVDDVPFFTMEYVAGRSLADVLRALRELAKTPAELRGADLASVVLGPDGKEIPEGWRHTYVEAACRLVGEIGEALQHAHEQGVIHRDVKPSNVLLRRDGHALLFDFGLARLDDELSLTRSGDFVGTPYYASPEQLDRRKRSIDARTDVYSLGVTLYELLTLQVPFRGESTHEVLRRILSEEAPRVRKVNGSIPRDLETICATALEMDPQRRYGSAGELAADLRRLLAFQPIHARPAGTWTRTVKLVQRNKAVSAAAALGFLLCVGTPLALWLQQRSANAAITREIGKLEQINRFLSNMFGAVDPAKTGYEAKVADMLDQAVIDLDESFAKDDEVALPPREAIGKAFYALGLYQQAEKQLLVVEEASSSRHGPDAAATLRARIAVAECECERGDIEAAERRVEDVVRRATAALGPLDPVTLKARYQLCWCLLARNALDRAEPQVQDLIRAAQQVLGDDDVTTWEAKGLLGYICTQLYRNQEALAIYEDLLPRYIDSKQFGPDHPDTHTVRHNLAGPLMRLGRWDEAEEHLRDVLDRRLAKYPDSHKTIVESRGNLAELYRDWAVDLATAAADRERLLVRALELLDQAAPAANALAANHGTRLDYVYKRGRVLDAMGRHDEAEPLHRELWRVRATEMGPDQPATFFARYAMIRAIHAGRRHEEAGAEYRSIVADAKRVFGPGSPIPWAAQAGQAQCLVAQDRLDEAEALLAEALENQLRIGGAESRDAAFTRTVQAELTRQRQQSAGASRGGK